MRDDCSTLQRLDEAPSTDSGGPHDARCSCSPGQRLAEVEVAAGRSVVGQGRQLHARLAAFRDSIGAAEPPMSVLHPAGVGRVHLDLRPAQLLGQVDGERVEGRLRRVVGKRLLVVDAATTGRSAASASRGRSTGSRSGRPAPCGSAASSACVSATTPKKFVSNVLPENLRRHRARGVEPAGVRSRVLQLTPALLTRMSSLP